MKGRTCKKRKYPSTSPAPSAWIISTAAAACPDGLLLIISERTASLRTQNPLPEQVKLSQVLCELLGVSSIHLWEEPVQLEFSRITSAPYNQGWCLSWPPSHWIHPDKVMLNMPGQKLLWKNAHLLAGSQILKWHWWSSLKLRMTSSSSGLSSLLQPGYVHREESRDDSGEHLCVLSVRSLGIFTSTYADLCNVLGSLWG